MDRLTERELNVMDCASYTKCNTDECVGYCGGCNAEEEVKLKLKRYEDLEEQGLLLKLPCKVGDTVYYPDRNWCRVFEYTVICIKKDCENMWVKCGNGYSFILGREIFLTRSEAEKALEEMKGE